MNGAQESGRVAAERGREREVAVGSGVAPRRRFSESVHERRWEGRLGQRSRSVEQSSRRRTARPPALRGRHVRRSAQRWHLRETRARAPEDLPAAFLQRRLEPLLAQYGDEVPVSCLQQRALVGRCLAADLIRFQHRGEPAEQPRRPLRLGVDARRRESAHAPGEEAAVTVLVGQRDRLNRELARTRTQPGC